MKIISFIDDQVGLRPVEVEISITKGTPKIQFLGLPDAVIKESVLRIQSAFRHCEFKLPTSKQIIVNLKPNYLKKSSKGLDLAVAAGILWEMGLMERPQGHVVALYGELSLRGEVFVPDDFEDLDTIPRVDAFYTGPLQRGQDFSLFSLKNLKDLENPQFLAKDESSTPILRPPLPKLSLTSEQADLLKIIALGEHPSLLAGPPGTGKTTLALAISSLLKDPKKEDLKKYQKISRHFGIPIQWRPIVSPHHTSTPLSMIGGGGSPRPGEITRAHGGVLIMDEFLEFDPKVQEALREPLESGKITISRTGAVVTYPADFLLLATTNLCPCGYLIPEKNFECRGKPRACSNYIQKLSGPMIDRFSILGLSHEWKSEKNVSLLKIQEELRAVQEFVEKERSPKLINNRCEVAELEKSIPSFLKESLLPQTGSSYRRYQALLKVARTIADLEMSPEIKSHHVEKSFQLTNVNIQKLKTYALNWSY